jgi:hypothetical protein
MRKQRHDPEQHYIISFIFKNSTIVSGEIYNYKILLRSCTLTQNIEKVQVVHITNSHYHINVELSLFFHFSKVSYFALL